MGHAACPVEEVERCTQTNSNGDADDVSDQQPLAPHPISSGWRKELATLMGLAAPLIVQMVAQQGMVLTDAACVGRLLGSEALAAAAVGNVIFGFLWYFLLGASTALDTLASQCHGAGDEAGVIYWTVTSGIVLSAASAPLSLMLYYSENFAGVLMGHTGEVAAMVGVFCRGLIPGLLPAVWAVALQKALATRNVVTPPAIICGLTALANIGLNLTLIPLFGLHGAPLATTLSRYLQFFATAAYWAAKRDFLIPQNLRQAEFCATLRRAVSSKALCAFVALALPGGVMLGLEAASFDATTALASRLGTVEVDAHTALLGVASFTYISLPFGLASAASIRVGNLLGAGEPHRARLSGFLSMAVGGTFMAMSGIAILCNRKRLGALFVSDPEVIALVASIAPIGAAFQIFDGMQGTAAGVLRGLGKQQLLVASNFFGLWCVGFALGCTLTFDAGLGLPGLWYGTSAGLFATMSISLYVLSRTDWELESQKAIALVAKHSSNWGAETEDSSASGHVVSAPRGGGRSGRGYVELTELGGYDPESSPEVPEIVRARSASLSLQAAAPVADGVEAAPRQEPQLKRHQHAS